MLVALTKQDPSWDRRRQHGWRRRVASGLVRIARGRLTSIEYVHTGRIDSIDFLLRGRKSRSDRFDPSLNLDLRSLTKGPKPNLMLVKIGRKAPPTDILGTILGCHTRIRNHLAIAHRLATTDTTDGAAIAEAAERVYRYFEAGLPLHTADEDKSLLPRLLGRSDSLDMVLSNMEQQHRANELSVRDMLEVCDAVRSNPEKLPDVRVRLGKLASSLSEAFEEHLSMEETVVFPAARALLSVTEKAMIAQEIRSRHRGSATRYS